MEWYPTHLQYTTAIYVCQFGKQRKIFRLQGLTNFRPYDIMELETYGKGEMT